MTASTLSPQELAHIHQSQGWRQRRIEVFDTGAGKVLAKGQRAERHPARYHLLNALARLSGVPYLKAVPMHGGARAQQVEVARLRALGAVGAPVPQVLHVAADHFVMQWLGGEHLGTLLQAQHPHAQALWREAGEALVRLHAQGQYLSQGFARNLIVDTSSQPPRLAGAIDFEDDPLEVMSVAEAQVRDWLTYLQSSLWTLGLPQPAIDAQLDTWMQAETPAVRALFLAAGRRLAWLRRLPSQRRFGRDTIALQAAAAAAHRYAQRHGAPPAPGHSS